jgi:hypothetical protein
MKSAAPFQSAQNYGQFVAEALNRTSVESSTLAVMTISHIQMTRRLRPLTLTTNTFHRISSIIVFLHPVSVLKSLICFCCCKRSRH